MFVSASLVMSCGGGNSGCGGYYDAFGNYIPGACPSGGPVAGFQLDSINVCAGPPASLTPTPTGTVSPTSTATACPQATSTSVAVGDSIQFHAEGIYSQNTQTMVMDITNAKQTGWTSTDGTVLVPPLPPPAGNGGFYDASQPGCACIAASSGGISSLPVGITVYASGQPTPSCTPCSPPTVTPSAKTAKAAVSTVSTHSSPAGVMQWAFDAATPASGPIAGAPDGTAYFITSGSTLYAISPTGTEKWHTLASGDSVAVSPDGSLVYFRGPDGKLKALSPGGKYQWGSDIALSDGPLTASGNTVFAVSGDGQLVAITSPGLALWEVPVSGTASQAVALPDAGVVAAISGGAVTAVSADGVVKWSFTPSGGFAGTLAVQNGIVYAGSESGIVYALDASTGGEAWHYASNASIVAGPVVDAEGTIFFASDSLYALGSGGAMRWSNPVLASGSVVLAGTANGVFVATSDGSSTAYSDSGAEQWTTRDFATAVSAAFAPPDVLYVANSDGRIFAVK